MAEKYWKQTEKEMEHRRNTNGRNPDYSRMSEKRTYYLNKLNMHDCNSGIFGTTTKINTYCLCKHK